MNNHIPHDDLATAAREKLNNMIASDEYSKLDSKNVKILSLMSKATALKRSVTVNSSNVTSGGGSGGGYRGNQGNKIAGVGKWRTFNKGATIQNKGKTVWWCLNHEHKNRLFYGLYV